MLERKTVKIVQCILEGKPVWLLSESPIWGFLCGAVVKNITASAGEAGDADLIPGLGRFPRGGNGNPLQYSCLGNLMDRGAWWATIHGVKRFGHNLATKTQLLYLWVFLVQKYLPSTIVGMFPNRSGSKSPNSWRWRLLHCSQFRQK